MGAWAVLHRLGPGTSAPLDSMRTDATGAYHFTIATPDTAAQYTVSVRYSGVAYVSSAVGPGRIASRQLETFSVFDTSSTVPITLSQRHLLVQPANPDGSFPVLELLVLRNGSGLTRVSTDTTRPTWSAHLIPGALDVEIGDSDLDHDAIVHTGDSVAVLGPLTPGDKQIVLMYVVPRGRKDLVLPRSEAIGTLGVMLADTLARPASGPLQGFGIEPFENIPYVRFEAKDIPAGPPVIIRLSRRPPAPADLWWVVVAVSALAMAAGWLGWWRAQRFRGGLSDAEVLALQVAALDAALESKEDATRRARRDELLARLASTLAAQNSPSEVAVLTVAGGPRKP